MDARDDRVFNFWCAVHRKLALPTRKAARRSARITPGRSGLREYRCSAYAGWWHNGHNPPAVMRGELTADEFYAMPYWQRPGSKRERQKERASRREEDGEHEGASAGRHGDDQPADA